MSPARRDPESTQCSRNIEIGELRDFLAADTEVVSANPAFRVALRERLWELIESRARHAKPPASPR